MKNTRILTLLCLLLAGSASAQSNPLCSAQFPFDGNLSDAGGNAYHGQMITSGGMLAESPTFATGKRGQALRLDGNAALRIPADLNYELCPQLTISGWFYMENPTTQGREFLFSTGDGSGVGMYRNGQNIVAHGGRGALNESVVRPNMWIFIAVVWDYQAESLTMYWGNRSAHTTLNPEKLTPGLPDLFVGAFDDAVQNQYTAKATLIDDLRIEGSALDATAVAALRTQSQTSAPVVADNSACSALTCSVDQVCYNGGCYGPCADDGSRLCQQIEAASPAIRTLGGLAANTAGAYQSPAAEILATNSGGTVQPPASGASGGNNPQFDNPGPPPGDQFEAESPAPQTLGGLAANTAGAYQSPAAEIPATNSEGADQPEATSDNEPSMPALVVSAVMDLQKIRIDRQWENRGDEYYLVTYKLRGFRGQGDRVFTFDSAKRIWPIVAGDNWAKKNLEFSIPQAAGRLTFDNLKPFEVYGFVAVVMEANKNSAEELESAFGFGEYQNELGVMEIVSGAFARAVPNDVGRPDYDNTSCGNVVNILNDNYNGVLDHFGNYKWRDRGLSKAIQDAIKAPLQRSSPDKFDGAFWSFYMNLPGGADCLASPPSANVFPPPGRPFQFLTESTRITGEHRQ